VNTSGGNASRPSLAMRLLGIDHVVIRVRDPAAMERF